MLSPLPVDYFDVEVGAASVTELSVKVIISRKRRHPIPSRIR